MRIMTLYRYMRPGGGVTVSPNRPDDGEFSTLCRLIADEGMVLTRGDGNLAACVDTDSADGWQEVEAPQDT